MASAKELAILFIGKELENTMTHLEDELNFSDRKATAEGLAHEAGYPNYRHTPKRDEAMLAFMEKTIMQWRKSKKHYMDSRGIEWKVEEV